MKPEFQGLLSSSSLFFNITLKGAERNMLMEFYLQLLFKVMEIISMRTYHEPHKLCEFHKWLSGSNLLLFRASHHPKSASLGDGLGCPKKSGELWQHIPEEVLTKKKWLFVSYINCLLDVIFYIPHGGKYQMFQSHKTSWERKRWHMSLDGGRVM